MNRATAKRLRDWPAARRVNALPVNGLAAMYGAPAERYVCFETDNFGWIFTPVQENGKRRFYLKE